MASTTATSHLHKPHKVLNNMSLYFSGEIAIIVINRGENRLNPEFLATLMELLDDVEKNQVVKGLVTTGVGKFYCNGLDLPLLSKLDHNSVQRFGKDFMVLMQRLVVFPIPTLAALNGHAFAGGALLSFCHDLRTMRRDKCWLCFNEVHINLVFHRTHHVLLRSKMGTGPNLSDALVLGKRFTAQEAFTRGLVHATASEPVLLAESGRLLKSHYGKRGYTRESLRNMKLDVYQDYKEMVDEEVARETTENFMTKAKSNAKL